MLLFHRYLYKYYNFLLAYAITVMCAQLVFYRDPAYIRISEYVLKNKILLAILDIISHWIPFMFVLIIYGTYYAKQGFLNLSTFVTLVFLVIYNQYAVPSEVYEVKRPISITVNVLIGIALYIVLSAIISEIWIPCAHI